MSISVRRGGAGSTRRLIRPRRLSSSGVVPPRLALAVLGGLARRPRLWTAALRQVRALVPPRWWRRPPFLPLPPAGYLAFRLQCMYGGAGRWPSSRPAAGGGRGDLAEETAGEIIGWLAWTARQRALDPPRAPARRRSARHRCR